MAFSQSNSPFDFTLNAFAYLKLRIKKNSADSNRILVKVDYIGPLYINVLKKYSPFDSILSNVIKVPAKSTIGIAWQVLTWPLYQGELSSTDDVPVTINKSDTLTYFIQCD